MMQFLHTYGPLIIQFLHDYGPHIIGLLITFFSGAGYKLWTSHQTGLLLVAARAAAPLAVRWQRALVDADRANPATGAGVGSLSPEVALQAKAGAVSDVLDMVGQAVGVVNPAWGAFADRVAPMASRFIEAEIEATKPKLPPATVALFPDAPTVTK